MAAWALGTALGERPRLCGYGLLTYAYDNRGRLASLTRTVTGTPPYSLSFTYDDQDRVLSISYPNGDVLTYVYGDHGKPIHAILNGTTYLVKGATYNAQGKVTSLPLGNSLQTTWQYWGIDYTALGTVNYGLPYRIQTGTVQNQGMEIYDAVGNVTNMNFQDHTTETLSFTYTPLNALASATGFASSPTSESLSYAQPDIANIGNKDNAPYNYGAAPIHATSAVGGLGSYTYDNNGNRSTDPSGLAFNYDGENHLLSLTSGPTTVFQNVYDGEGTRVVRYDQSAQTTHFVGEWYEDNVTTGIATAYYPFNGRPIAMKQGATLSYLHHDHLGSLVAATDTSGNEVGGASWARYSPFGQLRLSGGSLPSDRLFTGQTRDNVLGVGNAGNDAYYFFQARYYDATIGQFQAADTASASRAHPRGLNRYAYASNNPLKLRDSTGHASEMPVEMLPAGPLVNIVASQQHQPLVNIAPPTHLGSLVNVGQFNLGTTSVTTKPDLSVAHALVFTPRDTNLAPTIYAYEKRIERVLQTLVNRDVTVMRDQTESLDREGARASYTPYGDKRPGLLRVGDRVRFVDVMHETRHFAQDRAADFSPVDDPERFRREIDAYGYELRGKNPRTFGLTAEEIEQVQAEIQLNQEQLNQATESQH